MTQVFRITATLRSGLQIIETIRAFNIHGATRIAAAWAAKLKVPENDRVRDVKVEAL